MGGRFLGFHVYEGMMERKEFCFKMKRWESMNRMNRTTRKIRIVRHLGYESYDTFCGGNWGCDAEIVRHFRGKEYDDSGVRCAQWCAQVYAHGGFGGKIGMRLATEFKNEKRSDRHGRLGN